MSAPPASLSALRSATAALLAGIEAEGWTDAELLEPSLLPGWTRGHVLAHLARNADGITRTLSGALRGEVVARYPNGVEGRNADIEAGARRGFAELAADVRESAERLDRLFSAVADVDGWDLPTEDRAARGYVLARWREVEIHRVDLAGGYAADQWPAEFVDYLLPKLADGLAPRVTTALRIEVTPEGSVARGLAGRVWTVGSGTAADVTGPDWALLAWLVGRPSVAGAALSEMPELPPWA